MQSFPVMQITDCDVTTEAVDTTSSSVGAISRKTNAQPNGRNQRIYTSTPNDKFKKQQQLKQRNDAIGFCNLAKATKKYYINVGGKGKEPTFFDMRLKVLGLLFSTVIIGYLLVSLASKYKDI